MLVDWIKTSHKFTINQDYANYFIFAGLCSAAYSETMVNEISVLDRSAVIGIDIKKKAMDIDYIDYGENTVDICSEQGMDILDKWYNKWIKLIRNLENAEYDMQAALSGGFDTRMIFTLLLTAGIDLNKWHIRSINDNLHTHVEDYEIASEIAARYDFKLNSEASICNICENYSIEDILNISFYTKLCFHKQMYFKHSRFKKKRVIFTGNGGECVRAYWNLSREEYLRNAVKLSKNYKESIFMPIKESIRIVLETAFAGICNKYELLGRAVSSRDLSFNLYRETRCRNHFGKAMVESYFANQFTLSPLLDPDLHKLKLADEGCSDKNLLMAVIFDRYCKELLDFKIEGNRRIDASTIEYAKKINEKFPYHAKNISCAVRHTPGHTKPVQMRELDKVPQGEPDALLKSVFRSDSIRGLFSILFDSKVYEGILEETEVRKYFPLQNVYAAIAICKILQDELTCNTLGCLFVSDYVKSQMYLTEREQEQVQIVKTLANHPYLDNYITGRVDFKLPGEEDGMDSLEVVNVSDQKAAISAPAWINKKGCGYVVSSKAGIMRIVVRCKAAGELTVKLRGKDVRNKQGEKIPFWLDYSLFQVNGDIVFDKIHRICHDFPYEYKKNVQPGETVTVQVEWSPHDETTEDVAGKSIESAQEKATAAKHVKRSFWNRIARKSRSNSKHF